MGDYIFKAASTSKSVIIRIIDNATGLPETSTVYNTSGLLLYYNRIGSANVAITPAELATLAAAWASGGFIHIGSGYYRLDVPDAALIAGVTNVLIHGTLTDKTIIGAEISLESKVVSDLNDLDSADITAAVPTASAIVTAISELVVDDGGATDKTLLGALKDLVAYIIGDKTKSGTSHTYKDVGGNSRFIAVVDSDGNRTMSTRTLD